jgi:hypothetical protein
MYIRIYKLHPYSLPPLGVSHTKKSGNNRSHKPDSNERRKWYLLELNQGHMDFQSIALPPELRHQVATLLGIMLFPYCGCKGSAFILTLQIFREEFSKYFYRCVILRKSRRFFSLFQIKVIPLQPLSGCSAVGSALRSGRRGRQFESGHPDTRKEAADFQPPLCVYDFLKNNILFST